MTAAQQDPAPAPSNTRRRFLKGATAVAAGGAATIAMPNVSRAQTVVLKMQGAWGAKDIFNDMAQAYVTRVNEMSGGRLTIEYLIAGLNTVGNFLLGLFGVRRSTHSSEHYRPAEELAYIVRESQAGGLLRKASAQVVGDLLEFGSAATRTRGTMISPAVRSPKRRVRANPSTTADSPERAGVRAKPKIDLGL